MNTTRTIVFCGCLAVILSTLASAQVMKFDDNNIELDPGSVVIIDPVSGNIEVSSAHGDLDCSNPGGGGAGGRVLKLDGNTIELAPDTAVTVDPISGSIEVVSESGDWVCGGDDGLEGDQLAISGLQASPNPADAGDFIAFSYSTNGADFCQATGDLPGWTGQKPLNSTSSTGVQTTSSTPNGTYTAGLQCMTNAGDSASQSIEVTVQGGATVENPTISGFSASPNPATQGQSIVFSYSTTNAVSCQATGSLPGWSGSKPIQGPSSGVSTSSTTPGDYSAGLRCENAAGNSVSRSISVGVRSSGGTLAISGLSASPNPATQGDFIAISYSTSGADFCQATGDLPGWLGSKPFNSTSSTGVQTTASTPPGEYTAGLHCMTNAGDSVIETIPATLEGDGGAPGISGFSASPNPVTQGNNVSFDYSTFNADSCEASGSLPGWSGSKPTQGPVTVSTNDTAANTYSATLVCSNAEGETSRSISVTVQQPGAPTISGLKASPNPATQGQFVAIDYSTSNADSCQATGTLPGWEGPKPTSSDSSTGVSTTTDTPTGTYSAGLQCFNVDGDSTSSSINVTVQAPSDGGGTGDCAAHPPPAGTSRDTSIIWNSSKTTRTFESVFNAFPGTGNDAMIEIQQNRYAALSFNTGTLASGAGGTISFNNDTRLKIGTLAVSISRCRGDLGPQPDDRCRRLVNPKTTPNQILWRIDGPSTGGRCPLEPGTDYYLNIMPATEIPSTGSPSWNCKESSLRCGAVGNAREF